MVRYRATMGTLFIWTRVVLGMPESPFKSERFTSIIIPTST